MTRVATARSIRMSILKDLGAPPQDPTTDPAELDSPSAFSEIVMVDDINHLPERLSESDLLGMGLIAVPEERLDNVVALIWENTATHKNA